MSACSSSPFSNRVGEKIKGHEAGDGLEEGSGEDDCDCVLVCISGDIHNLGSDDEGCAGRGNDKSFIALLATVSSVSKNIRAVVQTDEQSGREVG